jgi:hypothetical protein
MFQAWDVKMSTTAASSAASDWGRKADSPRSTIGRNDRIGTLCNTSSNGIRTLRAARLRAAA